MLNRNRKSLFLNPLGWMMVAALAGCGTTTLPSANSDATGTNKGAKFQGPPTDAGVEVKQNSDAKQFTKLVADNSSKWQRKSDPFALTSAEKSFDTEQASERAFSGLGGFSTEVEAKSEVAPPIYVEAQPYRRLSGIVVGDSVVAILEMGEGREPVLIHPGQKVPNSPWTVVSIDEEKAILRRDGDVLPHEVQVRLETPPFGTTTTNAPPPGAGGFPGGPGGFPPGAGGGRFGGGRFGGAPPGGGGFNK